MKLFQKTRERLAKAAPVEQWTGSMNYPFNGQLNQPRQSLSKHEGTKRGEGMLHCDDLVWILTARRDMPKLLEALDIAMEALTLYATSIDHSYNNHPACDALEKIGSIDEES